MTPKMIKSKVSLIKGANRYDINYSALRAIEKNIADNLKGKKKIIIKPNFVKTDFQLAATHADHIRAILSFFREKFYGKIIICESVPPKMNIEDAFKNYGYFDLMKEYDVELMDLNDSEYDVLYLADLKLEKPRPVKVARIILDPANYIVSAARLKTHEGALVTLSFKNIAVGAILQDDKEFIHMDGNAGMNLNLFLLAQRLRPDLASIDGYDGMQGNGPCDGEPIDSRVALASTDFLAADRVATEVMGFDFNDVVYLNYISKAGWGQSDLKNIEILGEKLSECIVRFDPPPFLDNSCNSCTG